jgi:hypothetical protein
VRDGRCARGVAHDMDPFRRRDREWAAKEEEVGRGQLQRGGDVGECLLAFAGRVSTLGVEIEVKVVLHATISQWTER